MRPIPMKLKKIMRADQFMKRCCICGDHPQWHHAIIYSGRQLNERWAIVPACPDCHENRLLELQLIAFNRATYEELKSISKAEDWLRVREYLRKKYNTKET